MRIVTQVFVYTAWERAQQKAHLSVQPNKLDEKQPAVSDGPSTTSLCLVVFSSGFIHAYNVHPVGTVGIISGAMDVHIYSA